MPEDHLKALTDWRNMITSGRIYEYKETALQAEFQQKLLERVLSYSGPVGNIEYTMETQQKILRGSVDLALGFFSDKNSKIIAPLEVKGANTKNLDAIMPGRAKSPVQQAWEYATNAPGVEWVMVSNYLELRLYGFGEGTQAFERFDLSALTDPVEYARFQLLLNSQNLVTGKTAKLLAESRREDRDITESLYADYKALRSELIATVREQLPDYDPLRSISVAQTILDRVLFTAFAEDTGLLPDRILEKAFEHADPFNPHPIWDNFKGLFAAIDRGNHQLDVPPYNGGLFAQDPVLDAISVPDLLCERFKNIGAYDFASEVSVTVLGHIFEQSISDVERLQAEARGEILESEKKTGTTGRRKRDGVVYTPDYVARFIVKQTLEVHLGEIFSEIVTRFAKKGAAVSDYEAIEWKRKSAEQEAWIAYRDRLKTLRIVDPACGSGVFLVMAFDYMKAEMTRVNDKIAKFKGGHVGDLFDPDSEILTQNLFGVDVNAESIEIAKLSLWVRTARKGKRLDSLDANLKVGDSLIEDSNYAYRTHGFSWPSAFPEVFAQGGFDIVLGNPPYVRMELLKSMKPYLEQRFEVVSDRADLYAYFFERGLRLLRPGGRLGYISSNTFFKTGSGAPLRTYLLRESTLEAVIDFGDLQIFEGVTTYPAILTMQRRAAPTSHEIEFWKVRSAPELNFQAAWEEAASPYPQAALGSGSWELEAPSLRALRDKIRTGRKTLKEIYGSPLRGVVSGLNAAFVIDTATKERLCAQDPRSAELLKPFLEGKDLRRWRAEPRGLWLIYIPKNRIEIDDYPAIRDWLLPFKDKLERRATKQKWFELQQAQEAYVPHFAAPKIAYIDVCNRGPFSIEESGFYQQGTTFLIPSSDLALLGILNSKVAWFFFAGITTFFRGGYLRMQSQFLEIFPIPGLSDEIRLVLETAVALTQKIAKQRYKLQTALTRRIPDLCPPGRDPKLTTRLREWWTLPDFATFRAEVKKAFKADIPLSDRSAWEDWITRDRAEIARLSAEIQQAETEIDRIVYSLFDLTADEIDLLEATIAVT